MVSFEDEMVGLAPPGFSLTTLSCFDLRATAAASLAPEPSWVLELAELGGLLTLVVMMVGFDVELFPEDVYEVNFGTEEVLTAIAFFGNAVY